MTTETRQSWNVEWCPAGGMERDDANLLEVAGYGNWNILLLLLLAGNQTAEQ